MSETPFVAIPTAAQLHSRHPDFPILYNVSITNPFLDTGLVVRIFPLPCMTPIRNIVIPVPFFVSADLVVQEVLFVELRLGRTLIVDPNTNYITHPLLGRDG